MLIIKLLYLLRGMTEHKGRCLDSGSASSTGGIQWAVLFVPYPSLLTTTPSECSVKRKTTQEKEEKKREMQPEFPH